MRTRQVVVRKEATQRGSSTEVVLIVRYAECLKNHAANIGGYAVDGCREFMAARGGGEGRTTTELSCAACGCHRDFHRREVGTEVVTHSSLPS
ncbi:hypothetical protein CDL12_12214 [Handroanthus impetiginosus]|uniref:ZF-HD dimerization-type domain-containing protein n=1 Tax=Handroanthus impetiginosus TaxID=429701 RepID=A0A2G9HC91_9LAMI|nr:hypothetical protein CDL12_12214 [Handroanthus impetiginosus]